MRRKVFTSFMNLVTEIICIPSGQDRSYTAKEIVKGNSGISCRRICSLCMILPEDRDMRFGIEGKNGDTKIRLEDFGEVILSR